MNYCKGCKYAGLNGMDCYSCSAGNNYVPNELESIKKENAELKVQVEERKKLIEIQYVENQTLGNNNATLIHRLGELSEQIEKMKCCENCKHEAVRGICVSVERCSNFDKWELAE